MQARVSCDRATTFLRAAAKDTGVLAVVDARRLERECMVRSLALMHAHLTVLGYERVGDCLAEPAQAPATIILNTGAHRAEEADTAEAIRHLVANPAGVPVVVLSDVQDLQNMIAVIGLGARGFIPANLGVDLIVEAAKLACAGGVFLTTEMLEALRPARDGGCAARPAALRGLTERQAAVAEAVRLGKPNKIIAHELGLCESTVKVHVRTILKKLGATNRTEAAHRMGALMMEQSAAAS
jgi:DNA-binding NarL/FixJ family response regulator